MVDINKAFTVDENGLAIENDTLDIVTVIVNGSDDPTIAGFDAPIGSLYMRSNGTVYVKTAASTTDWTQNTAVPEMSQTNLLAFAARHG